MVDTQQKNELMTVAEVARKLRIGPNTVKRLIVDRELRGVKVANRWRIFADSVDALLLRGEMPDASSSDTASGPATREGADPSKASNGRPAGFASQGPRVRGVSGEASGGNREVTRSVRLHPRTG